MKSASKVLIGVLVLCGLSTGGYFWYRSTALSQSTEQAPAAAQRAPGVPVEVADVRPETLVRTLSAVGTLDSSESVILRPEIAGRIHSINFQEGRSVEKGTVLFRIDDSTYKAEAEQAQANLELSRKNYKRAAELLTKGAGTARQRDESQAQLRVDEAKAALALTMLDKTRIRSPFDGIVGFRQVSIGDYISPGQDLVNLESIQPLKVKFDVPQTAITAVSDGQNIDLTIDAFPGRKFVGAVYAIDPQINKETRSVSVLARVPNEGGELRPGLFANVILSVDRREGALLVPEEAVFSVGGAQNVYRIVDGKAALVAVTLGQRKNGKVEIAQGLAAGDTVVTAGYQKLRNGAPVMVLDAAKSAAK